jgi:hypothetical protein
LEHVGEKVFGKDLGPASVLGAFLLGAPNSGGSSKAFHGYVADRIWNILPALIPTMIEIGKGWAMA